DLAAVPLLESLVTMGRQLVYDSRDWRDVGAALRVLAPFVEEHRVDLADVNWRRLGPLRRALEHAASETGKPVAAAGARVRIAHHRDEASLAWLLAGALMAAAKRPATPPHVEAAETGDAALVVTIEHETERATITLSNAGATVERARAGSPLVVSIPLESEAEAVAAELRQPSSACSRITECGISSPPESNPDGVSRWRARSKTARSAADPSPAMSTSATWPTRANSTTAGCSGSRCATARRRWPKSANTGKRISRWTKSRMRTRAAGAATNRASSRGRAATATARRASKRAC